jgi:hypothetical protein
MCLGDNHYDYNLPGHSQRKRIRFWDPQEQGDHSGLFIAGIHADKCFNTEQQLGFSTEIGR